MLGMAASAEPSAVPHVDDALQPCQAVAKDIEKALKAGTAGPIHTLANNRCRRPRANPWDEPPTELKILQGAPKQGWHYWRDPEHLSDNCKTPQTISRDTPAGHSCAKSRG